MTLENFSCGIHQDDDEVLKQKQDTSETWSKNTDPEKYARGCPKLSLSSSKILLILLLCAVFFCFGALMSRFTPNQSQNQTQFSPSFNSSNFQNATVQKNASDLILSGEILVDVDPCEDFYEFACGNLAKDKNRTVAEEHFLLTLQLILGFGYAENRAEEKAQNFYRSCARGAAHPETLLLHEQLTEMLEKLEKIPLENLQGKLDLIQNEYGFHPFFTWSLALVAGTTNLDFIKMSSAFDNLEEQEKFTSVISSSNQIKTVMAEILGQRLNLSSESGEFEQLMNFDREIRELSQPSESESESGSSTKMSLDQLQNLAGFINWRDFLNSGLDKIKRRLNEEATIVVWCPQCLSNLSEKLSLIYLANSTSTSTSDSDAESQKLVEKFLIWQTAKEMLTNIFSGVDSPAAAATICSTLTTKYFNVGVASMHRNYVLKEYPELETGRMEQVENMVENIRDELLLVLKEAEWLDETSRDGAIDKARNIQTRIGYPQVLQNSTLVEESYEAFPKMYEYDFIRNIMSLRKKLTQEGFNLPVDTNSNDLDVLALSRVLDNNAYALLNLNAIVIPVRNLLPPHFGPELSQSYNYGRLGFSIGHELFHGFTNSGLNWDADGNFLSKTQSQNQSLWQTEETRKEIENGSSCLIRQYSKFSYPNGKSLNGTQTVEENFADNGGLGIAARALFRRLDRKTNFKRSGVKDEKETKLDTLADKRTFFISFAQRWCTDEPPAFSTDSHSPHKFRILGALRNSKEFSDAFNCPSKSRMNPQQKCSIV